ncbi:MAG TPA: hypothetical protein VG273_17735 [Bryobacteraceae bacterium]|jgi:hypothetical protein|nr:hypothetical protein [Bryobacteraceae bacterium]
MRLVFGFAVLLTLLPGGAFGQVEDEEFTGPFPSWSNLRRDYGTDSAALQRALNEVGKPGHPANLFIPAGTYCVQQLEFATRLGVSVLGEDPANTVLKYCGADRGVLLHVNGIAYSRIGRLTFDCAGSASVAVDQSYDGLHGYFDTGNEYSDVVFRNCPTDIRGGNLRRGFAETTVLRAHFGPSSGPCVILKDFNSLDLWIWYSLFDRCQTGVTNDPGAGNFNVYNSVFRKSVKADIAIHNTGLFNIRNNTSVGSNAFWTTSPAFAFPAQITLQGNKLIHVSHPAILVRDQGPVAMIDNQVESAANATGPAVAADALGDTDMLSVGNVFTTHNPLVVKGRNITLDDRIADSLDLKEPALPGTPRNFHRAVFEVPKKAGAAEIQAAIDNAVRSKTTRPVVHFAEGSYQIRATLEVPPNSDLQLVGDGNSVTRLNWVGRDAGPVIHVAGPTKVIFRELSISGSGAADGIVIDGIDQETSRVHMQQVQIGSTTVAGLLVDGLDYTNVDLRNIGHASTAKGSAIKVVGGKLAAAGHARTGRTNLFSGASSNNVLSYELSNGGRLLVRDIWYESNPPTGFLRLTGNGQFTMHGSRVALPPRHTPAAADLTDFHGSATFLNLQFDDRIVTGGDGANSRVLAMGLEGGLNLPGFLLNNSSPAARALVLNSRDFTAGGSSVKVPDQGTADPAFLREMLAQTRAEQPGIIDKLPAGVSDARLYRVWVQNATVGIHLKP